MNVNMVGTLIHREDRGAITKFYFSPSLVQLYEQSSHSKFNKSIAIEMLKTQLVFAKEFLSPAMLVPNANWNEVSMDTYQGENMYSITFSSTPSDKSTAPPKKKWWEFRKSSPPQSSKAVEEREVSQNMNIFQSKLQSALATARLIIEHPAIAENYSKKQEILGIVENLESAIRALINGRDDGGLPITHSMIGDGLNNMLEYMRQHGIWFTLHVSSPSDVQRQLDTLKDKIEEAANPSRWKSGDESAIEGKISNPNVSLQQSIESKNDAEQLASTPTLEKQGTDVQPNYGNQIRVCWSCKQDVHPISLIDTVYCSNCGVVISKSEPLQLTKIESLTQQKRNCPSCKNTVSPLRILGQLYCPECGVRF